MLSGNYTSKSRNKLIAKAFKEVGLIERYGSGIYRIQQICKEYGVVNPVFEEIANGFRVILFNEKLNKTKKPTEKPTEKLSSNQAKILDLIANNKYITSEELSLLLGIRADSVRENLSKLKNKGILTRIGPDKGGHWQIVNSNE